MKAKRPEMEDWSVESEIGSGGCGTVYVVRHRQTGERAALKVPSAGNGWGEGTTAEITALASMGHQHIVDLVGTVRTDRGEAILMEYLPGGSIADLIAARGPLGLGEAVTVIAPIAGALAFLHDHGGVHGDIAPGNVLFTAAGMPKLADLGLAVLVGGRQSESGTPGFRAPAQDEDDSGGKRLHPARDVFSLAALAWYMVTGRIAGPTHQRPPLSSLLGKVPPELVELLEDGLAEDERRRPTAAEFGRRIFEVAKPQPVNLRDAVRPEALEHMVTHVVADPGSPPNRHRRWMWGRDGISRRRNGPRPSRWHARERGAFSRTASAGASDRGPRAGGASGAAWRRGPMLWIAIAAVVLFAGFGIVGGGAVETQPSDVPSSAAAATAGGGETTAPTGASGRPVATQGSTADTPAAARPRSVLEEAVFSGSVPKDPLKAVGALTTRRDLALAAGDAAALRKVHASHGASLGPDLATASQLRARGLRYAGLETRLSDVAIRGRSTSDKVDVVVTSTISPYRVVGADGTTVATVERPDTQRLILRLVREDDGWLIAGVFDALASGQ